MGDAAKDDGNGDAEMAPVAAEALADLRAELARGREHENAAAATRRGARVGGEAMQDRQREGGCLAGASLRDAE